MADDLKVLREATTRHQKTKHPRWARLAEWATARLQASENRPLVGAGGKGADTEAWLELEAQHDPLDLPRLFAAIVPAVKSGPAAERVKLLSAWKDPRVVTGVLSLLEKPGRSATTTLPFFKACIEALKSSGDVRARDGLTSLSSRYKAIVNSAMGEVVAGHCAKASEAMTSLKEPVLSDADAKRLDELEQGYDVELRATASKASDTKRAKQSDDGLLAAIYANPDDDGPRLVFADTLTERGDERGEFISLQVRRAAGQGSLEMLAREQALYRDHLRVAAWNLPLSSGGECFVHRGFPSVVRLSSRSTKTVIGSPAWATVEGMLLPNGVSAKQLNALVDAPVMSRIRRVATLDRETREKLGSAPRPWRDVSMSFHREETFSSAALAVQFPDLTALSVTVSGGVLVGDAFTHFVKLESLSLSYYQPSLNIDWLMSLPPLKRLSVQGNAYQSWPAGLLARHPKLQFLALSAPPPPDRLEGLNIDTLDLGNPQAAALEAASRVLGRVRVLNLSTRQYAPVVQQCLPVWTTSTLERVNLDRHVRLERTATGWRVCCAFSALQLDKGDDPKQGLQALAMVPGLERLEVAPLHVTPLHRPNALPNEDETKALSAAWGSRLELLPSNPWLLEQAREPQRL
ncbi:MAG: TIGR02996 domain-containing protein [Myxococcaceae bacterium]